MIHSGISEEIGMGKLDVEDGEGYSFVSLLVDWAKFKATASSQSVKSTMQAANGVESCLVSLRHNFVGVYPVFHLFL